MTSPVLYRLGLARSETKDHLVEALSVDSFHDEVELSVCGDPEIVDGDNVGVLKLTGDAGLGNEALELVVADLAGVEQNLDSDDTS